MNQPGDCRTTCPNHELRLCVGDIRLYIAAVARSRHLAAITLQLSEILPSSFVQTCWSLVGSEMPLRFLRDRRALSSVLSQNAAVAERFHTLHEGRFATVGEYFATVATCVEVIDLLDIMPEVWRPTP